LPDEKEQLQDVANELKGKVQAEVITCDLGTHEGPYELLKQLEHKQLAQEIGIFINNAGFGWFGEYEKEEIQHIEQMIQLNVTSVAVLTKLILNHMVKRQTRGGILITSSTAASFPCPLMSLYSATKVFDSYLAVGIWQEQKSKTSKSTPVDIISLEPGATATEFSQVAGGVVNQASRTQPSIVVNSGLNNLLSGYPSIIPLQSDYLSSLLLSLLPRSLTTTIIYNAFKKRMAS